MKNKITLLDMAMDLAHQEFLEIETGNVDGALELVQQRMGIHERMEADDGGYSSDDVSEKLNQLRALQGRLTEGARSLQEQLRSDLTRLRSERTRLAGYGSHTRVLPLVNRFVSKQG